MLLALPAFADSEAARRGAYLAMAADCVACHTIPGEQPFAGGDAIGTPFGKIYPPNITPDKETGIGDWTDAQFLRAMWHGIGRKGEHLYPAFPYTNFTKLSERDVLDIRAFLATIPAFSRKSTPDQLIFPFNITGLMWFWNLLFLDDHRFEPNRDRSATWNRGAYLVTGMTHCGECHTPRNLLQAERSDRTFAGAVASGWYAPNLSSSKTDGLGSWSDEEIKAFLRTGSNRHGIAGGPMAAAVLDSFSHLDDSDLESIVVYLRSIEPEDASPIWPPRQSAQPSPYPRPGTSSNGNMLYQGACAGCHGADGQGTPNKYPAIAQNRAFIEVDASNVIQMILFGANPDDQTGIKRMPAFADRFTDRQVAEIVNSLLDKFDGQAPGVTAATVRNLRRPD